MEKQVGKILHYYYSGTGHTEYMVKYAREEFEKLGMAVTLCNVTDLTEENWNKVDPSEYDIIGFSYPIYGFTTPKNFDIFVKNLNIKDKKYFILKDSREFLRENDSSSRRIVKYLTKKGCSLLQEKHLLLPYNIHMRNDDRLVKQMLEAIDRKLPVFVKEVVNEEVKPLKFKCWPTFVAKTVGFTLWWGSKHIGNSMFVDENCSSCGLCANRCPQHNIEMKENKEGKVVPYFKNSKCMICMRCVMYCPQKSIHIKRFIKGWEVPGKYDFKKIREDATITPDYITEDFDGSMAESYKEYFLGDKD